MRRCTRLLCVGLLDNLPGAVQSARAKGRLPPPPSDAAAALKPAATGRRRRRRPQATRDALTQMPLWVEQHQDAPTPAPPPPPPQAVGAPQAQKRTEGVAPIARRAFRTETSTTTAAAADTPVAHARGRRGSQQARGPVRGRRGGAGSDDMDGTEGAGAGAKSSEEDRAAVEGETSARRPPRRIANETSQRRVERRAVLEGAANPFRGYEGCSGTDEEAAEVLLVKRLKHRESKFGRKQVTLRAGTAKMLGRVLRNDVQMMEKMGFDVNIHTHNACLYILKQHELSGQCQYWLRHMREVFNVSPDVKSYNVCMAAAKSGGAADDVPFLFDEMRRAGIAPNDASYNVLLSAAPYADAEAILARKVRESEGAMQPRLEDYNNIITKAPSFRDAYAWLRRIADDGFKADRYTIGGLLKVCGRAGDVESAEWVASLAEREGVVLDTVHYTALLAVYQVAADWDGYKAVWARMRKAGMKPNRHTFLTRFRIIKACAQRPGDFFMLRIKPTIETADLNMELSSQIWTEVFLTYAKVGDVKGAQEMGYVMHDYKPAITPPLQRAYEEACKQVLSAANTDPRYSKTELWVTHETPYAVRKTRPPAALAGEETAFQRPQTHAHNRTVWRPPV